jgi:uncharacterized protein involved in response to NO
VRRSLLAEGLQRRLWRIAIRLVLVLVLVVDGRVKTMMMSRGSSRQCQSMIAVSSGCDSLG